MNEQVGVRLTCGCFWFGHVRPLVLQGDEGEVDPLSLQELAVCPALHRLAVLEPDDDVCVPDGGEAVCDGDGRSSLPCLGT